MTEEVDQKKTGKRRKRKGRRRRRRRRRRRKIMHKVTVSCPLRSYVVDKIVNPVKLTSS
jgi:hypothetical protein